MYQNFTEVTDESRLRSFLIERSTYVKRHQIRWWKWEGGSENRRTFQNWWLGSGRINLTNLVLPHSYPLRGVESKILCKSYYTKYIAHCGCWNTYNATYRAWDNLFCPYYILGFKACATAWRDFNVYWEKHNGCFNMFYMIYVLFFVFEKKRKD